MRRGRLCGHILGLPLLVAAVACCAPATASALAPANDNFADRDPLGSSLPVSVAASNVDATLEAGEPSHPGYIPSGHSIWFEWEAPATELITIGTCGSDPDTILTAYTGSSLGALSEISSNRYSFGATQGCWSNSEITFRATAGTTYQIQVDGNGYHPASQPAPSGEGDIELRIQVQPRPANDDLADAVPIPGKGTDLNLEANNWGATEETGEPNHRGKSGGSSVWFKWTAARTNGAYVQVCGGRIPNETVVAVYTGASVGALSPVPELEAGLADCEYSFAATVGITYWIAVDGKPNASTGAGSMADLGLSLGVFPGNDDFEAARELEFSNGLILRFGNLAATKQVGEPNHAGSQGGASVWFSWTAPITGSVRFSACQASFRTLLAVYTGSSLQSLNPVASSDNPLSPGCWMGTKPEGLAFNIEAGTRYRVAVDGYGGATGGFNFEINTSSERLSAPAVAPNTRISKRKVRTRRGIARFTLAASEPGAIFLCKLDSRRFKACGRTVVYRNLKPGRHVFQSKAVGAGGLADPTPVRFAFTIPRRSQ